MRILVAGAGIAGLTFAALMKQRGRNVELIDAAEDPSANTFPIVLAPIGSRVLHSFGVLRRFRAANPGIDILRVANIEGRAFGELDMRALVGTEERCRVIQRAALLRLLAGLSDDPPIRAGTTIQNIADDGKKVTVFFSDGTNGRYDLVVGADGMHSALRQRCMPQGNSFDTHWGAWMFSVDNAEPGRALEYWSSGRMLALRSGAWEMTGLICAPANKIKDPHDRKERVQYRFRRAGANAKEALDAFPGDAEPMMWCKIEDVRAERWVQNRVCLLGDAACSFLPTSPLGAAMAMESASVLADELSRAGSATIPQALAYYEKRCRPRSVIAQDESRRTAAQIFRSNPLTAMMYDPAKRFADYRIIGKLLETPV